MLRASRAYSILIISLAITGLLAGCGESSKSEKSVGENLKTQDKTLICDYSMSSSISKSLNSNDRRTMIITLTKTGDKVVEAKDQNYVYRLEKTVARTDEKNGEKFPAYSQLVDDGASIKLLLEVSADNFTHETVIDKAGNFRASRGLANLSGNCREGKPVY